MLQVTSIKLKKMQLYESYSFLIYVFNFPI